MREESLWQEAGMKTSFPPLPLASRMDSLNGLSCLLWIKEGVS
jgi:hypothetical protein